MSSYNPKHNHIHLLKSSSSMSARTSFFLQSSSRAVQFALQCKLALSNPKKFAEDIKNSCKHKGYNTKPMKRARCRISNTKHSTLNGNGWLKTRPLQFWIRVYMCYPQDTMEVRRRFSYKSWPKSQIPWRPAGRFHISPGLTPRYHAHYPIYNNKLYILQCLV
jgi:hypothetical protein